MFGVFIKRWKPKRISNNERDESPGTDGNVSPEPPDRPPGKVRQVHPEDKTQVLAYDSTYRRRNKPKTLQLEENHYNHLANTNVAMSPMYPLTPNICVEGGKIEFIKSPSGSARNSAALVSPPHTPLLMRRGSREKREARIYDEPSEKSDGDKELLEKRIKQLEAQLEEEKRRTQRERMAVTKLQNKLIKQQQVYKMTALDITEPNNVREKCKRLTKKVCNAKILKKRLPIIKWFPRYNTGYLIQDAIAGLTVGLTSIPQGIAYAVIAGLPPEYGLYASLTAGVIYAVFGSCKDVSIGPTAILSALTAKYVSSYSADFAVLATFFTGVIILTMGILQLGFLVDFISAPVVSGFTTAAAIQIAASQLKSFFGLEGSSGNYFSESVYNFIVNIKTINMWDTLLGSSTIILLVVLKKFGQGCSRQDVLAKKLRWFISLGRNAVVVILGMIIAYTLKLVTEYEPLTLIGKINGGLPKFGLPPFSTTLSNETYTFEDMLEILGPKSIVLPFVAVLEIIAIAKVFSEGSKVDATQEMIALGLCNVIGSFCQSMPITAAFTRTTLNHVSGAQTPAVGIATVLLITLALTFLTSTFYFIPKATLAGMIIMAVVSMIDISIFTRLWSNCKRELPVVIITMFVGLFCGLEYGITAGILFEALILLYKSSKPAIDVSISKTHNFDLVIIKLPTSLSYCGAEHISKIILKSSVHNDNSAVIIDGTNLQNMDTTVASNLVSVVKNIERSRRVFLINFRQVFMKICESINPKCVDKFINNVSLLDLNDIILRRS